MNRIALTSSEMEQLEVKPNRFQQILIQPRQRLRIIPLEPPNAGALRATNRHHRARLADKIDEAAARQSRLADAMLEAKLRTAGRRYMWTCLRMAAGVVLIIGAITYSL